VCVRARVRACVRAGACVRAVACVRAHIWQGRSPLGETRDLFAVWRRLRLRLGSTVWRGQLEGPRCGEASGRNCWANLRGRSMPLKSHPSIHPPRRPPPPHSRAHAHIMILASTHTRTRTYTHTCKHAHAHMQTRTRTHANTHWHTLSHTRAPAHRLLHTWRLRACIWRSCICTCVP
jgi:hypothetical protein